MSNPARPPSEESLKSPLQTPTAPAEANGGPHPMVPRSGSILDAGDDCDALELLEWAVGLYGDDVAVASSFGAEDTVLIDLFSRVTDRPRVFTLDTGRLPPETYRVMEQVEQHYGLKLEVYFPDQKKVEEMVRQRGINLFYDSLENRKLCCGVRKVEPLQRALANLSAWATGLRREQSSNRSEIRKVEQEAGGRVKLSPLADWSNQQVWHYIRSNDLPYNELHDHNYPSIGCAPCTRAVRPHEDPRAGRWWWEESTRECGLHVDKRPAVARATEERATSS